MTFQVTESSYELLKKGRHAIWGYDRKMRPVVFLDLFNIDSDSISDLLNNAHLLMSLAYSKMMFPGINDGIILVVDASFRHFVNQLNVKFQIF